jgi:hypothetical protein
MCTTKNKDATPRDRKTMQLIQMSSIPNSNPFASWDPLLQMPCGPLSTKAMQRTLLIFGGTMKVVK